jgi:L-fuculose-phosphate aldolase
VADRAAGANTGSGPAETESQARARIVAVCRQLDGFDLNAGRAGNLSLIWARGQRAGMLITPSALSYERMSPDDLAWVPIEPAPSLAGADAATANPAEASADTDVAQDRPESYGPRPASSEWRMHLALQRRRDPRSACVLHVHSPYATALACLPRVQREGIPAFHYMVAAAGGNDIRCAAYETFGSEALSLAIEPALDGRCACLLAHHGLLVTAGSPEQALERARETEWLARVYWQALQIGEPALLDDGQMADVHARFAASAYRREDGA